VNGPENVHQLPSRCPSASFLFYDLVNSILYNWRV
jgi:hypothetical protein